ncbi:MAG: hypothetical protein GX811_06030, partial [Lentisphaerae bacterium]|nr:hypothetical protein [Lentisphaerota bacterium]
MNHSNKSFFSGLKAAYDKLFVVFVLLLLIISVIVLGFFVGKEKKDIEKCGIERRQVEKHQVEPVDPVVLSAGIQELNNPFVTARQRNRMMVAEIRVSCAKCFKPIPITDEKCSFCGSLQHELKVENRELDSDGDGM